MKLMKRVKSWFFAEAVRWKEGELMAWLSNNGYQYDLQGGYDLLTEGGGLLMKVEVCRVCVVFYIPNMDSVPAILEYYDDMDTVYQKVEEMAAIAKMNSL